MSVFLLKSRKKIPCASIGDQCSKHLFYGENGVIEKALGEIEGALGAAIGDRSREHLEKIADKQAMEVGVFLLLQRSRTVAAGRLVNAVDDGVTRRVWKNDPRLQGIDMQELRLVYEAPHLLALQNAAAHAPVFLDMELKVLVTDKKPGFILSDDPVVLFNQYAERSPHLRSMTTIGWTHKGLQVFMPVSASTCLALFDPTTYEYGSPKSRICTPSVRDVKTLNMLQALNARQCFYFNPAHTPAEELARLADEHKRHDGWRQPTFHLSEERPQPDGGTSQILAVRTPQVHLPFQFGFARIIDKLPDGPMLPVRSPELVQAMEQERYRRFPDQKQAAEESERHFRNSPHLSQGTWRLRRDPG